MDLGLTDRVYVVTGGTKGLGFAGAQALVADGARVVVSSRSHDSVEAAVARLGDNARGVAADNADPGTPDRLVDAAIGAWGRIDGALLSVGGPPGTDALGATDAQWQDEFDTVFLGTIRMVRAVAARLQTGGAIGLVLSTSAKSPIPNLAISNGFRPGLAIWAKQLADDLGPSGVRVVSFLPGRILTDRTLTLNPDPADRDKLAAGIPLRRYGDPEEFGRVAAFTLSPAASYLTGCAIPVDGGALRVI
ncbi:MAG TPA: SDR family oxidoreductase [Mycobacteriales bacterium]|jgi:3-oxoacyl-[acyl-carrier protein] reductase|nr:SDR family oxidoreductase [Mycobacteriales bacterium]